jgi:choline dehydrogenase-like flavoprotein
MLQKSRVSYDVIVVGSGASGGWAAKRLTEAGLNVALVEAGRPHGANEFREHTPAFALEQRNRTPELLRKTRPIQAGAGCDEFNYKWFVNDHDEPYTTPAGKPFAWLGRLRLTGGRTNVWGRQSYRFSDQDFKAASFDGFGEDWPLGYKDLELHYDLVEEYVGISGRAEGLEELPDSKFLPAMALTCAETRLRQRVKSRLGWTVTPGRVAVLTRPQGKRAPCHYCGPCQRGCVAHAYFNSAFTTVADAMATGHCTHIPNAMAYKVLTDTDTHKATGVLYIDRDTREPREVHAKAVVLCAQALESARILLNSASHQDPGGLSNSSGVLEEIPDGPHLGRGRRPARSSPISPTPEPRRSQAERDLHPALRGPRRPRLPGADTASEARRRRSIGGRPASARPTRRACASPSPPSASEASASACPTRTTSWRSTRAWWTRTGSPCSASA